MPGESEVAADREDYLEVDRRRDMEGSIVREPLEERRLYIPEHLGLPMQNKALRIRPQSAFIFASSR